MVSPSKVFVSLASAPLVGTSVKFNCSVNSPQAETSIVWLRNSRNLALATSPYRTSTSQRQHKKWRQVVDTPKPPKVSVSDGRGRRMRPERLRLQASKDDPNAINDNVDDDESELPTTDDDLDEESNYAVEDEQRLQAPIPPKYSIVHASESNETFKLSTLTIHVRDERDFGVYECFAKNRAGAASAKFYIYGESRRSMAVPFSSTVPARVSAQGMQAVNMKPTRMSNERLLLLEQPSADSGTTTSLNGHLLPPANETVNDAKFSYTTSSLLDSLFGLANNTSRAPRITITSLVFSPILHLALISQILRHFFK